jgi:hypothetical protein
MSVRGHGGLHLSQNKRRPKPTTAVGPRSQIDLVGYQLSVILSGPATKAIVEMGASRPKNGGTDIFAAMTAIGTRLSEGGSHQA